MKTDALARRLRHAPPHPVINRLSLQEADLLLFAAIDRHGPLPTHYLYRFTRHLRKDYIWHQKRLTELYNGDHRGAYLVRPPRQFEAHDARYQHTVYDLAPRAKALIKSSPPPRSNSFVHDLMKACVSASIELAAGELGIRFIPRAQILDGRDLRYPIRDHTLIPDDLFALEYPDGTVRYCALEVDRGTESIKRANEKANTFARKVDAYLAVLSGRLYKDWLGIHNLGVLIVTTYPGRVHTMLDYLRTQHTPRLHARFAFSCEPIFGTETYAYLEDGNFWRVPKEVLTKLLTEPWQTTAGEKDLTQP